MRTLPALAFVTLALVAPVNAFSCSLTTSSVSYDLNPLAGLRHASKESSTPPTTSEARVAMDICSQSGVQDEDGLPEEDQCPPNTLVCLRMFNHKSSAAEQSRVTAVIPLWNVDTPESEITYNLLGSRGADGLRILIKGPDYAGLSQHLNFSILCDETGTEPDPTFVSYSDSTLGLEWKTPQGCPVSTDDLPDDSDSPSQPSSGGMWSFIKFLFWMLILGLILYFALGIFYNHQQYSARGWDLIPHRDFWRELPALLSDLASHLFANVRGTGAGGRGAYSSLG